MTVSNAQSRTQQIASGLTSQFSIPFQFERNSDLQVYLTPNGQTPDPTTDVLTLNTDYTVVGAGWGVISSRYILLTVTPSSGDTITIIRNMPLARETDFAVSGEFSAADLNDQFDDVVGMIQQVNTKLEQLGLLYDNNQILDPSALKLQNRLPKLADATSGNIPIWSTNASGSLIATTLEENPDCSTLRTDLANDTNGTDGSRLVGYYNASLTPANTTVKAALDHVVGSGPVTFGAIGQVIYGYFASLSGWLELDDGTIGSTTAPASPNPLTDHRDNAFENLFTILWDNVTDVWCPVSGGRGASASVDWANNKYIQLPRLLGRSIGCYGTSTGLTETLTVPTPPSYILTLTDTSNLRNGMKCQLTTTTTLPTGLATATDYWITVLSGTTILLSDSTVNYTGGNPAAPAAPFYVQATSSGSGTHTLTVVTDTSVVGEYVGYGDHTLTKDELSQHTHTLSPAGSSAPNNFVVFNNTPTSIGAGGGWGTPGSLDTTGLSESFSIYQPTAFMKAFIKYQ